MTRRKPKAEKFVPPELPPNWGKVNGLDFGAPESEYVVACYVVERVSATRQTYSKWIALRGTLAEATKAKAYEQEKHPRRRYRIVALYREI